jgi:hypothetical protein
MVTSRYGRVKEKELDDTTMTKVPDSFRETLKTSFFRRLPLKASRAKAGLGARGEQEGAYS